MFDTFTSQIQIHSKLYKSYLPKLNTRKIVYFKHDSLLRLLGVIYFDNYESQYNMAIFGLTNDSKK